VVRETLPEALAVPSESRVVYQFVQQSIGPVVRAAVDRKDHRTARRVASIGLPDIYDYLLASSADSVFDAVPDAMIGNLSSREVEVFLSLLLLMMLMEQLVVIGREDEEEENSLLQAVELDPLVLQVDVDLA
jgi:hypothetical protein